MRKQADSPSDQLFPQLNVYTSREYLYFCLAETNSTHSVYQICQQDMPVVPAKLNFQIMWQRETHVAKEMSLLHLSTQTTWPVAFLLIASLPMCAMIVVSARTQ